MYLTESCLDFLAVESAIISSKDLPSISSSLVELTSLESKEDSLSDFMILGIELISISAICLTKGFVNFEIKKRILGENYKKKDYKKVDYKAKNVYLICNRVIDFFVIFEIKKHPKSRFSSKTHFLLITFLF